MRNSILLFVVAISLIGLSRVAAQGPKQGLPPGAKANWGMPRPAEPARVRWEYRVEYESSLTNYSKRDLQAGLNALGADAWELIAMESSSTSRQGMFIFRRPLAGQPKPEMKPAPEKALKEKAEPQLELRLYPLKFADVHELSQLINSVLRDRPIRLAAEPRTNQLIVNATMESHGQIQMLLERLDIPMDTDKAKPSKKGR